MRTAVDGVPQGGALVYTNERNSHKAFVPTQVVVEDLPAGQHTIGLAEFYDAGGRRKT